MLARLTISGLEEVDEILDRFLLVWSQLLGRMEIVRDEARDIIVLRPNLKYRIVSDTGKEKIPKSRPDPLR